MSERDESQPVGSLILHQTEDGQTHMQCRFEDETIWLSQALIGELFQKDVRTISEHLLNIHEKQELDRAATIGKFRMVRQEGSREVSREIEHYSLRAILAVGYRVRSSRGTSFGSGPLSAWASISWTQAVFQVVQNKLHFAATGKTAPELIAARADAAQPNMGLTAWKGGAARKGDVMVAKNYLNEREIDELNRIVVMFLDFAGDGESGSLSIAHLLNRANRSHDLRRRDPILLIEPRRRR